MAELDHQPFLNWIDSWIHDDRFPAKDKAIKIMRMTLDYIEQLPKTESSRTYMKISSTRDKLISDLLLKHDEEES